MQTATTTDPTQNAPEVPKDRAEDTHAPKPPLTLDAEPVEERLLPFGW